MRNYLLATLLLCALVPLSYQQCLTASDEVRKVSEEALKSLQNSELQFSVDLLRTVSGLSSGQNVIFSPTSVFNALLLGYFLSANHTEADLKKNLHLAADKDKLDILGAYNLGKYYQKLSSMKENYYQMGVANRIYTEKSLKVQHCIRVMFADEIQQANFKENTENVVRKINNWVSDQTNKFMKDFLSHDAVSSNTLLILLNAAYFKGHWEKQFDKEDTSEGVFYLSNGTKAEVLMMVQENEFKMIVQDELDAEILELPYIGKDISMFVILPLERSPTMIQELINKLDSETLIGIVKEFAEDSFPQKVLVRLPKFAVEEEINLVSVLEAMGVGDIFKETCNLSTLTGSINIHFTDAIHKAKVNVDEKGTEAAAATALVSSRMGSPEFSAHHPFLYFLFNNKTNTILFFGIFSSPS